MGLMVLGALFLFQTKWMLVIICQEKLGGEVDLKEKFQTKWMLVIICQGKTKKEKEDYYKGFKLSGCLL